MNGWICGYVIGLVVVVIVVAVLLLMIQGARRTAAKAEAILVGLQSARDGAAPLWEVHTTVATADRIVAAAARARRALTPGGAS